MARPIWSGSISFGLVNVPVRLYPAVQHKEVRFHQLHDKDGARIELHRVCSAEGKEVPYEHVVKGFEVSKGRYVEITKEELAAFAPQATRQIEIEDFVELSSIDPVYYDATYYLAPDKGAAKAYSLLLEAMKETGKVGIGRMVMRTKEYLCAIRPLEGALAISTLQYADEIVAPRNIEGLPVKRETVPTKQLKLAQQLVEQLAGPFQPAKYHDTFREKVEDLLEKKAAGEQIVAAEAPEKPSRTVDLMEALRRSLESGAARGGASAAANVDEEPDQPARPGRRAAKRRARPVRARRAAKKRA
jgi:DNA end-binding protein Ku